MSMNRGSTDTLSQEQVLEALNKYDIDNKMEAEKKNEQKEFNAFVNAIQDMNAYTHIAVLIHQYQETRKEALLTADMQAKVLYEAKTQEFVKNIEAYYAGNIQAAQQAITEYEKKTPPEKIQALDNAINDIKNKREDILKKWVSTDRNMWFGQSWEQAVKDQASYYTARNIGNVQAAAKENITTLEQKGAHLTEDEQTQLSKAGADALRTFKEALELLQLSQGVDPINPVMLEVLHVGLITNTTRETNQIIEKLNNERPDGPKIPPVDLELRKALKFTKETAKSDRDQIATNIQNHILLKALNRQEQALNQTKAEFIAQQTASAAPAANIIHCEVKATSPSVYDSDFGSRFALHPHSSNNFSILKKATDTLNQQTNSEKLIIHKQKGRNIEFEFKGQRFNYNSGSGQFSADNIRPETFQMMMKLYNQVYKGSNTQINCDDQESKKLCENEVTEFNKASQNKMTNPRVILSSAGKLTTPSTEKTGVTKNQEAEVKQDVSSSRRM